MNTSSHVGSSPFSFVRKSEKTLFLRGGLCGKLLDPVGEHRLSAVSGVVVHNPFDDSLVDHSLRNIEPLCSEFGVFALDCFKDLFDGGFASCRPVAIVEPVLFALAHPLFR